MGAFPSFLAAADPSWQGTAARTVALVLAWGSGLPGLVCSMIAFVGYVREVPSALRDGRRMRAELDAA
jgi:hypothetical protein